MRVKAIKTQNALKVKEERVLVQKQNQICVTFKFYKSMKFNIKFLGNIFVCEVCHKLNDNPEDQPQILVSKTQNSDGANFQSYIDAARDMKIPWDIFENLVLDLPRNLSESKQIIDLLLKELKNSRDKSTELNAKLENSMKLIYQFHEATKKICTFQSGVDIELPLAKKRKIQHDIESPKVPISFLHKCRGKIQAKYHHYIKYIENNILGILTSYQKHL